MTTYPFERVRVRLTSEEVQRASAKGMADLVRAIEDGRVGHDHGRKQGVRGMNKRIVNTITGAITECALARYLGVTSWPYPPELPMSTPDVRLYECKGTLWPDGGLYLSPSEVKDKPERLVIVGIVELPYVWLRGWLRVGDITREGYWREDIDEAAWYAKGERLNPMMELPKLVGEVA